MITFLAPKRIVSGLVLGLAGSIGAYSPVPVHAAAVIFNNVDPALQTIALGVNDYGHLNIFDNSFQPFNVQSTGLSRLFADGKWRDATAPGCLCEGWGVAASSLAAQRFAGWANQHSGSGGLTGGLFGSTATTATSEINLSDLPLKVVHAYGPSIAPNAFQGNVTITNTGSEKILDVVYRRVMDWDVPPTEFYEYVSHFGVVEHLESVGGNLRFANNNGFANSDPRVLAEELGRNPTINVNFSKEGPADQGSVFDFAFGDLEPGQSRTFNLFYGAAADLAEAQRTIAVLKPDVWSFGQSSTVPKPGGGGEGTLEAVGVGAGGIPAANDDAPTFLFAFGGVGGVEPGTTPEVPLLPFVPAPGEFEFPAPTPRRWFDPPFVDRFDYSLTTGEFLSFILPPGFGSTIDLYVGSSLIASDLTADGLTEYLFSGYGLSGVTAFSLRDIAPLVDVADSTAFPTFLDFTPGSTGLMMKSPLSSSVPGPLPALGLSAAFAVSRKLRGRIKASAQ